MRWRRGRPIRTAINGQEELALFHDDVMLEAATTSFQWHLQVPANRAVYYFDAALIMAGPVLAASRNSPLLFGGNLWSETRIPLFEQAIPLPGSQARVSFGRNYVQGSWHELFAENVHHLAVLLPELLDDDADTLPRLRLHKGTIWGRNRPLSGFDEQHRPHPRIEHRPARRADVARSICQCGGIYRHCVVVGQWQNPRD